VCFAPILTIPEAYEHPHNQVRGTFVTVGGLKQPGPAPRFSRSECEIARPAPAAGEHTDEALGEWGFSREEIRKLRDAKAVA
jgi:alpha-methylacyl-CoA racemase